MRSTITFKLLLALIAVFTCVLAVSTGYQYYQQKTLINNVLSEQLHDKASNYFDSLNMMMLTGTMAQKETLRQKALAQEGIEQVRVLRADAVSKFYGPGDANQKPVDDIDQRALNGELVIEPISADWGKGLVVALPMKSSENYRGTNCLACHQAEQGDILGAIRITYNLNELDESIDSNMLKMAATQITMFVAALIMLSYLLRKVVLKPIRKMHKTLALMEKHSDLSHRVEVTSNDEIGQAASALNAMTLRFADSLHQVVNSAEQLEGAAQHIDATSRRSKNAADQQNQETGQIQHAITTLHTSISQVMSNAELSSQASVEAKTVARDGVDKTDQATLTIEKMNAAMASTSAVVTSLDERTAIVEEETAKLHNPRGVEIEVRPFDNLLMHFAETCGAHVIIRGLRAVSDFEYEFQMTAMNEQLNREIETVFLMADVQHQAVASRLVKEIAKFGGDISSFVTPSVRAKLLEKYK